MMTFLAPLLAATAIAQFQGGTLEGAVVDKAAKPVVDAQVLFFAPAPWASKVKPVEVRTTTDADGRFRLSTPSLQTGVYPLASRIWVDRPGSGIASVRSSRQFPRTLVLRAPKPRTIKIEGPLGHPVAAALVWPRLVSLGAERDVADMPEALALPMAVTTGPDGTAIFNGLAAADALIAVRITAESIGTQEFALEQPGRGEAQAATLTIRLKSTSGLTGRVRNRLGEPLPNRPVEVWFNDGARLPSPVGFKTGPILTAADGSFQIPDKLMIGSFYRVAIRAPGMEPILSDWITIGEKPRVLLPMLQRPLRTISGRVVDRQGKPVAGVEVLQAGDGPERTHATRDRRRRSILALAGFRQGLVFVFALR